LSSNRSLRERVYGSFEPQIPLESAERGKAKAYFRTGILTVIPPKRGSSTKHQTHGNQ
jgi:HSP20 family molecular chaperone IbpA